jgi:hypothetical protein
MNNNFFSKEDIDNLKDGKEMFTQVMQKALIGKQSDFILVKS